MLRSNLNRRTTSVKLYVKNLYTEEIRLKRDALLKKIKPFVETLGFGKGSQTITMAEPQPLLKNRQKRAPEIFQTLFDNKKDLYKVIRVCEEKLWKESK